MIFSKLSFEFNESLTAWREASKHDILLRISSVIYQKFQVLLKKNNIVCIIIIIDIFSFCSSI